MNKKILKINTASDYKKDMPDPENHPTLTYAYDWSNDMREQMPEFLLPIVDI